MQLLTRARARAMNDNASFFRDSGRRFVFAHALARISVADSAQRASKYDHSQ